MVRYLSVPTVFGSLTTISEGVARVNITRKRVETGGRTLGDKISGSRREIPQNATPNKRSPPSPLANGESLVSPVYEKDL